MASNTNNVKLGVCRVIFDGVDLGYTKGGVEVSVATSTHEIQVDQFGDTPIGELITGRTCSAKVPLAEVTLDNLLRIMPGATLTQNGGVKASQTVTFSTAAPSNNDAVTIGNFTYTFKTAPAANTIRELAIPGTFALAAAALADAINRDTANPFSATVAAGVVTVTADDFGTIWNGLTVSKVGTNIAVGGATTAGGANVTKMKVSVPTAISLDMRSVAKELVLHPADRNDADRTDDFVIPLCAPSGGLEFAYRLNEERVFNVMFKAYPNSQTNELFIVGDKTAA